MDVADIGRKLEKPAKRTGRGESIGGPVFDFARFRAAEGENDAVALTAWGAMPPALREELWMELRDGLRSLMAEAEDNVQKIIQ